MTSKRAAAACLLCLVLSGAAVWFGGLNQDEGWYLYAARLVGEGQVPYRDFFFTQGPVLPYVYAACTGLWLGGGLLAARLLTLAFGLVGLLLAVLLVRRLVPAPRRDLAGLLVLLLLGGNLYHLYYLAIPKTYALASLFVQAGFLLLAGGLQQAAARRRALLLLAGGFALALAAGTRISLLLLSPVVACILLAAHRRFAFAWLHFGAGVALGLTLVYGPFLLLPSLRAGFLAAQSYHAARAGFSPLFIGGSISRLLRWYLPLFLLVAWVAVRFAPALRRRPSLALAQLDERRLPVLAALGGFAAVAIAQLLAPHPYEDYQVPVMGLLAVGVTALLVTHLEASRLTGALGLTAALTLATAGGSPLLEQWTTDGHDRFWPLTKERSELGRLREAARALERLDPGGKTLLTQDLYLAIESGRRVPRGLEMGPFSALTDAQWRELLTTSTCPVAAVSGYTFAIEPPSCRERAPERQAEFRAIVSARYEDRVVFPRFGQHATTLVLSTLRKEAAQ